MTFNDLEWCTGCYFCVILPNSVAFGAHCVKVVENKCVRKRVTANQVRTAGLVQECTMFRDGLVRLPDAFTVGDFTGVICVQVNCSLLSIFLFFFLFPLYFVYDLYNK